MSLQTIKSVDGYEYVLVPIDIYEELKHEIHAKIAEMRDFVPFVVEGYIKNPVALARINLGISRNELAKRMGLSEHYLRRVKRKESVTSKFMKRVKAALAQ